jgi:hypothetical protein
MTLLQFLTYASHYPTILGRFGSCILKIGVCLLLAVATIHGLPLKSIDLVLAFPQADLELPVFMELLLGFYTP